MNSISGERCISSRERHEFSRELRGDSRSREKQTVHLRCAAFRGDARDPARDPPHSIRNEPHSVKEVRYFPGMSLNDHGMPYTSREFAPKPTGMDGATQKNNGASSHDRATHLVGVALHLVGGAAQPMGVASILSHTGGTSLWLFSILMIGG